MDNRDYLAMNKNNQPQPSAPSVSADVTGQQNRSEISSELNWMHNKIWENGWQGFTEEESIRGANAFHRAYKVIENEESLLIDAEGVLKKHYDILAKNFPQEIEQWDKVPKEVIYCCIQAMQEYAQAQQGKGWVRVEDGICSYCKGAGKIFHWGFGQFVKCGVCQKD